MLDEQTLHTYAREKAAAMIGAEFDKKMLRWNDVVAVGVFYSDCGVAPSMDVARYGIVEALQACDKANLAFYAAGRGPLTMIQPWMVTR